MLKEEVKVLAEKFNITEEEFKKKYLTEFTNMHTTHYRLKQRKEDSRLPHGSCVFLKGNDCSIHEFKPLHCRVTSCCSAMGEELSLWFMQKYFVNENDPESIKEFEQYKKLGGKTLHKTAKGKINQRD